MKMLNWRKSWAAFGAVTAISWAIIGCSSPTGTEGQSYTLTFDQNGGSGTPPNSRSSRGGDIVTLPGNTNGMTKGNAGFGGWNTSPDGTGILYGIGSDFTMPNSNVTLYAKWNDSNTTIVQEPDVVNKFEAKPSTDIGINKIRYSFSYDGYDFYYIYLGELRNVPLFSHPAEHHNGMSSTYTVSRTETIINTLTETISNSSQTTISIIEEHTKSQTTDIKASQAISTRFPIKLVSFSIKATAEQHWNWHTVNSKTSTFQQIITTMNTVTRGTEHAKTTLESRTWNFNENNKIGYYRYTLFSASDVYLYVIKNQATGEIDYEFREFVIPGSYYWQLDFSETPSFIKNDATGFEFNVSILENLPEPQEIFTAMPKKTIREEFTAIGDHTYTFNESYPAAIEVYVLGAGGGGQGGHRFQKWWVGDINFTGTGGQGGGGAAAYAKFTADESVTFNITIGKGGDGASGRVRTATMTDNSWHTGNPGSSGESSSVRFGLTNITVGGGNGGSGGGGGGTGSGSGGTGGGGGAAGAKPGNIEDSFWESANGGNGRNGSKDGTTTLINNAASISSGSLTPFGGNGSAVGRGGQGGYSENQSGSRGGDGYVVIVITEL